MNCEPTTQIIVNARESILKVNSRLWNNRGSWFELSVLNKEFVKNVRSQF